MLGATPSAAPLPSYRTYLRMLAAITRPSTSYLSDEFAAALLEQYARAGMLVEYVDVLCARARSRQAAAQAQRVDHLSPSSLLAAADFGWTLVDEHASS